MGKELDKTEKQKRAEEMHELHNHILELKRVVVISFIEFGKTFVKIFDGKLYESMADTFEEYLGMPEIGFDRSTVYALMKIYRMYIQTYKVPQAELADIHWTKLNMIAPVVTDKNYKEMLDKARDLSRSDLRKEVDQMKSNPNYTGTLFNDEDLVLDGLKMGCPIHRGNICPFFKKYKHDILKEQAVKVAKEKEVKSGRKNRN